MCDKTYHIGYVHTSTYSVNPSITLNGVGAGGCVVVVVVVVVVDELLLHSVGPSVVVVVLVEGDVGAVTGL